MAGQFSIAESSSLAHRTVAESELEPRREMTALDCATQGRMNRGRLIAVETRDQAQELIAAAG